MSFICACGGKAIVVQTAVFKGITYRRRKCQACGKLLYTAVAEQQVAKLPADIFARAHIEKESV